MATMRASSRLQVGSTPWIQDERSSAMQIVEAETEEFAFSARNEVEWLNEHMGEIFNENQINVAEIFKTPGKLRGKTPRTVRKANPLEVRAPLSDIFSATPRGGLNGLSPLRQAHAHFDLPSVSKFRVAEDQPSQPQHAIASSSAAMEDPFVQKASQNTVNNDSGYFGSQYASQATQPTQSNQPLYVHQTPKASPPKALVPANIQAEDVVMNSPELKDERSVEGLVHSVKEDQMRNLNKMLPEPPKSPELMESSHPILESPLQSRTQPSSPQKRSPQRPASPPKAARPIEEPVAVIEDEPMDDAQSPSEGSSPIRPIVRKSSLNFASLPAREPITTKKSIGNRVSRTSQLDQTRKSYYGRQTGGKSLGNARQEEVDLQDDEDEDEMVLDEEAQEDPVSRLHNKTSTQRLQDQISMLGKSQAGARPHSKSNANAIVAAAESHQASQPQPTKAIPQAKSPSRSPARSPTRSPQRRPFAAPGSFPEDEEDSWIGPSNVASGPSIFSPRPALLKSHTTEVMEGIHGKDSIGGGEFSIPKRGESPRHRSPLREPAIPERSTSTLGHIKSVSTSVLRSPRKAGDSPGYPKLTSVSNPTPSVHDGNTPPKSPSRSYKGSPLKAAKDKFSSILKTSRGLFASSAAVSAEAKTSTLSPSSSRMGLGSQMSFEQAISGHSMSTQEDLNRSQPPIVAPNSPGKASIPKTRASTEREERRKEEEAREARETKEAQKMQDKLEKARQKVKEEARVFQLEQERVAEMQKQVIAKKEQEKQAKASQAEIPRATRTSPRKTKAQLEAEGRAAAVASTDDLASRDVEMADAHPSMLPPARPKSQIGRPVGAKRPVKPTVGKAKPPTVIRVDTGSSRGHIGHQYHPSNSTLAATLQESLTAPTQPPLRNKASSSSIASTASKSGNYKSAATKALESAARKKAQEELDAKRKKEAKEEIERQRATLKEEERRKEEQQRHQEIERQKALQREKEQAASLADAKKSASRQALDKKRLELERAKQTAPPPPALRQQPSGDLDKPLPSVPRIADLSQSKGPPRINPSNARSQDDSGRITNSVLHNSTKLPPKRPLQQDVGDEYHSRPTMQRNPPSYQQNEHNSKRRKTSDIFDHDDDMNDRPKMTAPPVRQSSSRPKDLASKFPIGYTAVPQNNLQKSTLMSQHSMNQKTGHPLDMAQVSKAPIPFASSSTMGNAQHKTPARSGAPHGGKSAAKSSPRYQNGENIELPEINTDSEDDDDDDDREKEKFPTLPWVDSPALHQQLQRQETIDPSTIFGQPPPLNMEEVFSKNKDRWHKFRQRTSSANWSGQDRLTEDEVRKDLAGRDKIQRQGGWTYDSVF